MPLLTYDLDLGSFVAAPLNRVPLTTLSCTRGDSEQIGIQFSQSGVVQALSDGAATAQLMMKLPGQYEGQTPLVSAPAWVSSGAGVTALYTFTPSLNTNALNMALVNGAITAQAANDAARFALGGLVNGNIVYNLDTGLAWQVIDATQATTAAGWTPAPALPSLTVITEVQMIVSGSVITLGDLITTIWNDYIKGTEGSPSTVVPSSYFLLSSASHVWRITIGDDGVLLPTQIS